MNFLNHSLVLTASTNEMLSILSSILPLMAVLAASYFMLIRPEKKRKIEYQAMLSSIKVNDEIITKGGIMGKIIKLDNNIMVIESGPDRVRLRMAKDAILRKVEQTNAPSVEEA